MTEIAAPHKNTTPIYPQTRRILEHLRKVGSITNVEAQAVHRCRALPRRISDLEAAGYDILRETLYDCTGQRYVRYHLVE